MIALRAIRSLGPVDYKTIRRDTLLRWIVLFPVLIAIVLRLGVPVLTARVLEVTGFDLRPYYPLVMGFIFMMMPMMVGIVIGFLLLDQRDDQTLTALQVTPITLNGYLAYRISLPVLLSLIETVVVIPAANLIEVDFFTILLVALACAPLAPLYALTLASLAQNKVQGMAVSKGLGISMLPPAIAFFVTANWQLVLGFAPTYWPAKLFWVLQSGQPGGWAYFLAGLAYELALIAVLLRRFDRVMHT